jgi:uroporphyrin-III C-methyltransferase/precorrin-2 dehydrogenase/sirohydrochlorin ferrochelatase
LVGAGPGDPELLTLRAVRALQSADIILFDDLVSPEILEFARREAKKMRWKSAGPSCTQDEINGLMVGLAKAGRRVVRLKGGDPMICRPRRRRDPTACSQSGVAIEIVPGITAAQGAASRLCVSLTERRWRGACNMSRSRPPTVHCRRLSTGGVSPTRRQPASSTCRSKRFGDLSARAIAAGLDPATPAVAVARATRRDEARIVSTIAELPERLLAPRSRFRRGDDWPNFASLAIANPNATLPAASIQPIEITSLPLAAAPHFPAPQPTGAGCRACSNAENKVALSGNSA